MTGAFGAIAGFLGVPIVVQMHGIDWKRSRWGPLARFVIRGLELVVMRGTSTCTAVSQTQCAFYAEHYGRHVAFIPTGTHVPHVCQEFDEIERLGLEPGKYVLFASRLVSEKGAHYLISAFRDLRTDYKLVIAGGSIASGRYAKSLKELAGADDRIVFPGFVGGRLKDQLLSHAAIFVQPSEIEGLSISLLDAMSYGLPCLSSDIPENREAIGRTGAVFQSGNVPDLRRRLEELLLNKSLRAELGAAARDHASRMFTWDHVTTLLESLYLGKGPKVPMVPEYQGPKQVSG